MKEFVLDLHTHTLASGHAYGTIREMAQAAAERELTLLGISEHGPGLPDACHPIYFLNLKVIPREMYGVKLLFGCEMNVLPEGRLDLEDAYVSRLDYGIVGLHTPCNADQGAVKNTDNLIACMRHPMVSFVSHPDDSRLPVCYPALVEAAKEYHVALEVNNTSLTPGCFRQGARENYLEMLPLCQERGVPIIVNTDAHDPSAVGIFPYARKLLEELNFDENLILNTSAEKVLRFIGK